MNKLFLSAVSAIALMGATPAMADKPNMNSYDKTQAEKSTGDFSKDVENAVDDVSEAASSAAKSVSDTAKDTYKSAKKMFSDSNSGADVEKVTYDTNATATGIIGNPVMNYDGDFVANISDIILDENGQASMVIMADGAFTGIGKLVAFDYGKVMNRDEDGDFVAPLTEEMIDSARAFSYDATNANDKVQTMPKEGYSVNALLDGELVDAKGETLAEIDDLVFVEGRASDVVVGFGQILGMGGEQAIIAFKDANMKQNDDSVDFKLSANQARDFKAYKKTISN